MWVCIGNCLGDSPSTVGNSFGPLQQLIGRHLVEDLLWIKLGAYLRSDTEVHELKLRGTVRVRPGWVLKVGELLIPMVAAMRRELISGSCTQADETPVDVQIREGRGKNHQTYLWQYTASVEACCSTSA
jgi:Transposase IS66 family